MTRTGLSLLALVASCLAATPASAHGWRFGPGRVGWPHFSSGRTNYRLSLSLGAESLRTEATQAEYLYSAANGTEPLSLVLERGLVAGSLRLDARLPLSIPGLFSLEPGFALVGLRGEMWAGKLLFGLRIAGADHAQPSLFVDLYGGLGVLWTPIGRVSGPRPLITEAGEQIRAGETISATGLSGGAEVGVGYLWPMSSAFGFEVRASANLWTPVTDWFASASGSPAGSSLDGRSRSTIDLGTLTGITPAHLTGATLQVGIVFQ
jgi:hypothetical protein